MHLLSLFVSSIVLPYSPSTTRLQPVLKVDLFVFRLFGRGCLAVDFKISKTGKSGSRVNGWVLTSGSKVFGGNENASAELRARRTCFSMPLVDNACCILYIIGVGFGASWEMDILSHSSVQSSRSSRLMTSVCTLIFRANCSLDSTTSPRAFEVTTSAASNFRRQMTHAERAKTNYAELRS